MEAHRSEFRIEKMCTVLQVARSGFYAWRSRRQSTQKERKGQVQQQISLLFHDHHQRYGSPKMTKLLHRRGVRISSRTVSLYMRELGLRSCVSRKFRVQTTDSAHPSPVAPNVLNQNFVATAPNEKWVADVTSIPCRQGRLYLASVMDLYTREIVGWCLRDRMTEDLVVEALKIAYQAKKPKPGLLHHSDRGSQYASKTYCKQLECYQMTASMSRKGNCYDNAVIEAFHSVLKKELVYVTRFQTHAQAYDELYRYLEFFYNRKRMHSALGYLSPAQFAARWRQHSA
nr:IS3 family transposase [Saccharibacillus sacchari]